MVEHGLEDIQRVDHLLDIVPIGGHVKEHVVHVVPIVPELLVEDIQRVDRFHLCEGLLERRQDAPHAQFLLQDRCLAHTVNVLDLVFRPPLGDLALLRRRKVDVEEQRVVDELLVLRVVPHIIDRRADRIKRADDSVPDETLARLISLRHPSDFADASQKEWMKTPALDDGLVFPFINLFIIIAIDIPFVARDEIRIDCEPHNNSSIYRALKKKNSNRGKVGEMFFGFIFVNKNHLGRNLSRSLFYPYFRRSS